MRRLLVVLAAWSAAACGAAPGNGSPDLRLQPCWLQAPGIVGRIEAACGTWVVPENRDLDDASGRRIDLRVAVVPAVSRTKEPDPLVFLTGGPGQAATESYVQLAAAFRRIERERDILLVDQRGTGRSNPLRCADSEDQPVETLDDAAIADWVRGCLASLDADPAYYTTSDAVRDLDEVRAALGYERINLYGGSYGTRVALAYLREHGDRVRSAILDGVAPPNENLGVDVARDAQRAFDALATRCRGDETCSSAFPTLEDDLARVMEALEEPVEVTVRHPTTGEEQRFPFHRSEAASALRLVTYGVEKAAIAPLLLRTAVEGDLRPLAAQFLLISEQLESSIANGMGFSVVCSEDYPFYEPSVTEALNEGTYLGAVQTDALDTVCPIWPTRPVPGDFKDPVRSDVPVLLLSGELDPVTPPENAELVAQGLGHALHVIAPGQGHITVHRGCVPRLAAELVERGTVEGLDPSCVDALAPYPFFLGFAGPTP